KLANLPVQVIDRAKEVLAQLEANSNRNQLSTGQGHQVPLAPEERQLSFFIQEEVAATRQQEHTGEQLSTPKGKYDDCLEEIKQLELATMTPIEALNTLFQLQQKLKERK